jgi:hypothetical protein
MSETSTEVVIHHLVEKDPSTMTGNCSVCGFVGIAKSGRGFMCGEKKKAAQKAWRAKNPERSAADRRRRSDHELFAHDYVANTATCMKCGPVAMTPWGRGNACAKRAAELRTVQEAQRQEACRECWIIDEARVYPENGACPRCTDPRRLDTGSALRDAEYRASNLDGLAPGFMTVDLEHFDAEYVSDDDSVVPGWNRRSGRVLGSSRPWNEV